VIACSDARSCDGEADAPEMRHSILRAFEFASRVRIYDNEDRRKIGSIGYPTSIR